MPGLGQGFQVAHFPALGWIFDRCQFFNIQYSIYNPEIIAEAMMKKDKNIQDKQALRRQVEEKLRKDLHGEEDLSFLSPEAKDRLIFICLRVLCDDNLLPLSPFTLTFCGKIQEW